ncbi:hypothetical protein [Adhaeribacter rhizoryzae]|nr:hypothetical protein [Adhaeribacter rhizoryzae]
MAAVALSLAMAWMVLTSQSKSFKGVYSCGVTHTPAIFSQTVADV